MANIPYDLHIKIIRILCRSWQREDSIFRCCTWALKSNLCSKNCAAPCVHLQNFGFCQMF